MEHLIGTGADAEVIRQVHPTDISGRIDQKLRRPRNVLPPRTTPSVQQVVSADHLGRRIRQKGVGVSPFLALTPGDGRRVHANGHNAYPSGSKIVESLLETPQLGVAERSPVAAIKNEYHAVWWRSRADDAALRRIADARRREEGSQRNGVAKFIRQAEVRSLCANAGGGFRRWQLLGTKSGHIDEQTEQEQAY
jgi:hypothetical protein